MFTKPLRLLIITFLVFSSAFGRADNCASDLNGEATERVHAEVFARTAEDHVSHVVLLSADPETERKPGLFKRLMRFPGPIDLALAAVATDLLYRQPEHGKPAIVGIILLLVYRGLVRVVRAAATGSPKATSAPEAGLPPALTAPPATMLATMAQLEHVHVFDPVLIVVPPDEVEASAAQLARAGYVSTSHASVRLPSYAQNSERNPTTIPSRALTIAPVEVEFRAGEWLDARVADAQLVATSSRAVAPLPNESRTPPPPTVAPLALPYVVPPNMAMVAVMPRFRWPLSRLIVPAPAAEIAGPSESEADSEVEPRRRTRRGPRWPRLRLAPKVAAFVGAVIGTFFGHGSPADPGVARPELVATAPAPSRPFTGFAADPVPELPAPDLPEPKLFALTPPVMQVPVDRPAVDHQKAAPPAEPRLRLVKPKVHVVKKPASKLRRAIHKKIATVRARLKSRRKH